MAAAVEEVENWGAVQMDFRLAAACNGARADCSLCMMNCSLWKNGSQGKNECVGIEVSQSGERTLWGFHHLVALLKEKDRVCWPVRLRCRSSESVRSLGGR